jgi:hypothetical protein
MSNPTPGEDSNEQSGFREGSPPQGPATPQSEQEKGPASLVRARSGFRSRKWIGLAAVLVVGIGIGMLLDRFLLPHRATGGWLRRDLFVVLGSATAQEPKTVEGEYLIESALKPGMVLDVAGAKTEDLTPIQLAGPGNQENRRWRLISIGKGEYLIETALKKGVILDVRGATAEKGTLIQLGGSADQPEGRGTNRRWKLIPTAENGEYRIESLLKEGLVLEVKDGKAENLTPIQVGEWENEARQRWRLIRVDLGK